MLGIQYHWSWSSWWLFAIAAATLLMLDYMLGSFTCPLCASLCSHRLLLWTLLASSHNKAYILMQETLNPLQNREKNVQFIKIFTNTTEKKESMLKSFQFGVCFTTISIKLINSTSQSNCRICQELTRQKWQIVQVKFLKNRHIDSRAGY